MKSEEAVLGAIVARGTPCLDAAGIATATGTDAAGTLALLADLEQAGLVARWAHASGLFWTLTPLAAARLGARLSEGRWIEAGRPLPRERAPCQQNESLDWLPDPWDRDDADAPGRPGRSPPRPTHYLGIGRAGWPGPTAAGACPICGGAALPPDTYCLGCDRWAGVAELPRAQAVRSRWDAARRRAEAARLKARHKERRHAARAARAKP